MKNKDEILRKFDEAIQYSINCSDNLPGTTFCSNVDKLIDIKCDIANGVEQSESTCNLQIVSGSVFMLLDEDDDVITPLYTTKPAAIKRRAEMLEQNLRERITINEIDVNKY